MWGNSGTERWLCICSEEPWNGARLALASTAPGRRGRKTGVATP